MSSGLYRLAEAVDAAWYAAGRPGDDAWALGVVAALTMCKTGDPDGPDPAKVIQRLPDEQVVKILEEVWSWFFLARPELCRLVRPIAGWCEGDPPGEHTVRGLAAVARTVMKHRLWQWSAPPAAEDVLGVVHTEARSQSARHALGEYYTPQALCQVMAEMILGDDPQGTSVMEPAAGTGGMLLGCAKALAGRGKDPASYVWVANDVNPVAVACLAVNVHVWGLGPNVVLGVADSLAEPKWYERAWEEQKGAIAHRNNLIAQAGTLAAIRQAEALITGSGCTQAIAGPPAAAQEPVAAAGDTLFTGTWCHHCGINKHDTADCPRPAPGKAARQPRALPKPPPDDAEGLTLF